MTTVEFLSHLRKLGVTLTVDEGRLRLKAPKEVLTPSLRTEISQRKPEILAFLNDVSATAQDTPPLQPVDRKEPLPLSFAQQRLWFLDRLSPEGSTYHITSALRIEGHLNLPALEQALGELVRRHEILRTSFGSDEAGQAHQIIKPVPALNIPVVDLQQVPAADQERQIRAAVAELFQKPFDLARDLLVRVQLLQVQPQTYIAVTVLHHIIADGWSLGVFTQELGQLYQAFQAGQNSPLPELGLQYADYAAWQREYLRGSVYEAHLNYWKTTLHDAPTTLALPLDHPRPAVQSYQGQHYQLQLSPLLKAALETFSRENGVTLYVTLLTAFATLLYRYTGQDDILIGTPIANRNRPEIETLIGLFVNTLVIRTRPTAHLPFGTFVEQVRDTVLGAQEHQDFPLEKLMDELRVERSLSYNPLFQVMFILQNIPSTSIEQPDLQISPLAFDPETAKFDLTLEIFPHPEGLTCIFEYNTDIFEAVSIQHLAENFNILLEGLVTRPADSLSELPLLSQQSCHKLLYTWNDTGRPYPLDQRLSDCFQAQVERTPQAPAVILGQVDDRPASSLSYERLNRQANQLAHYLQQQGVGPGSIVGICLDRSFEMMVSLLGILKTGAAYVPLDPTYPQERLTFMVSDSTASFIVSYRRYFDRFPDVSARLIGLDDIQPELQHYPATNLVLGEPPSDVAYVMYTSGSTGRPKGVQGLHRGALNRFHWMWETYPFEPGEICCQKTTLNFVDSIWEIFGPLLQGTPSLLIPDDIVKDPKRLILLLARHNVTRLVLVPSLLQAILESDPNVESRLPHLRLWITSGEALSRPLADRFQQQLPGRTLINLYGSTEVSADCTYFELPPGRQYPSIPIGRPIANTQAYILDARLQPVPIGVIGELYIGGTNVARGYLNQPELTHERFVPDPFQSDLQARLYRMGDLARYRPDGLIEFHGRRDHQVKLRGFRIELGEVEAVLAQHPDVQQAVVMAREDQPGQARLVGYLVPKPTAAPTVDDLRSYLKGQLPEYMIPAALMLLDHLPLTPNGKVDRHKLPAPDQQRAESTTAFQEPRNDLERQLIQIWEEVLGVKPIGVHDNFFALGGHSLLAVYLFARIETQLGVNLPLASLFQNATVEHLAQLIAQKPGIELWSSIVPMQPEGSHPPLFCIHGITGDILWFRDLVQCLAPDYPVYGLQARGLNAAQEPFAQIETMAAAYIQEIRQIQTTGPYYLGGASFGGTVALEIAQQLLAQGQKVALLAIFDHSPPNVQIPPSQFNQALILVKIIKNFPHWLKESRNLGPARLWARLLRKTRLTGKKLSRANHSLGEATDLIDYANELPDFRRELISNHYQIISNYIPQPYPGQVTLFRAKSRPLLNPFDPELGWQQVAPGKVDVRDVPGSHEGMFRKPHVDCLALQLRICLEQAQQ